MNKPRVVAVMPVSGREELFPITIKRLYQQEGVRMIVICLCDTAKEFALAQESGAVPTLMPTGIHLGEKWQIGVEYSKEANPDALMIVGSGNWFTNGWVKTLYPYLDDYDMVGSEAMYVYQIREKDRVLIHWGGYHTSRKGDMLGAGRLISRRILDKADWQVYDTSLNSALDRSMTRKLRVHGAKTLTLPQGEEMILKVGSWKWKNINSFGTLWGSPNAKTITDHEEVLKHFPEAKTLLA